MYAILTNYDMYSNNYVNEDKFNRIRLTLPPQGWAECCILCKYFSGSDALNNKEKNFAQVLTIPRPIVPLNNWTTYYILDMN